MGFNPSKADADVWMKRNGNLWEYIAVYVDDLAIATKDPQAIINQLTNKYKYKIKGDGPMEYHLGGSISHDKDGTLVYSASRYVDKLLNAYECTYGELPKMANSPLEHGDHPEVDMSPELDDLETT